MGAYVKIGNSMHWDESIPDPNPNGGSVIDGSTGQAIPGANRQSYSSGPGGNGPVGSPANPNGTYHGGPGAPGTPFGSGGFVSGQPGQKPINPQAPNGTPWFDWIQNLLGGPGFSSSMSNTFQNVPASSPGIPTPPPTPQLSSNPMIAGAQSMGQQPSPNDWFTTWALRQQQDAQAQKMAANMQMPQPFAQSGIPEGSR